MKTAVLCLLALALVITAGAADLGLTTPRYTAAFSPTNGALTLAETGREGVLLRSGEAGLWQARFRDNSSLRAADFKPGPGPRSFAAAEAGPNALRLTYTAPELTVTITATALPEGLDLRAEVKPGTQPLLDLALPGRLRFAAEGVRQFVASPSASNTVGIACQAAFFQLQPQDQPSGWRSEPVGPQGYAALYGGPLDQRPDRDPLTALTVTAAGREWLPEALAARVPGAQAFVNRPPTRAQTELTLVDSANGPFFSANHLGGQGWLWRVGGGVREEQKRLALDLVTATLDHLAATAPAGRRKVGLLALAHGPERGGWADVAVSEWLGRLRQLRAVAQGKLQFVALTTAPEMLAAARSGEFLGLLKPYGEWAPVPEPGGMEATVAAVGEFVRAGGNWFEVGGHPFYYAMRPVRYLQMSSSYPPAFADFAHLESAAGNAAVYGVQPLSTEPWTGAQDRSALFIPGRTGWGGDETGGYYDHSFQTYVNPGESWTSPVVRVAVGHPVTEDLAAYARASNFTRRLSEKLSPELFAKFRQSVLLFYAGNARDKLAHLAQLPSPTLVHFSDYLKGGFDKEYPDHLPPNASFGTPAELRQFFDRCHELGLLVMPYTNPTWWCDHPKGPTFAREGEAPLLKNLEGKPQYERYGNNDGWTVCHWHPAVRAANAATLKQFSVDFPVDVLFQDQCGARGSGYDLNPASPTPYAYTAGMISQVIEDSRVKPLSTENGWDQVANHEAQLCGMSWGIVPTEGGPAWRQLLKEQYPPATWTVFPVAQYLMHDKVAFAHHDLGQFVTNREVLSWTLGLGYGLSYRLGAAQLDRDANRQWLLWLDRLQKSVCARYTGEPLTAFAHDRGPQPTVADDGLIRAQYGPVRLVTNLGPAPRSDGETRLPPFGFYATAPGLTAGNLARVGTVDYPADGLTFVTEGDARQGDIWVYAPPGQPVTVPVPAGMKSAVQVQFDDQPAAAAAVTNGALALTLPRREGPARAQPPADLAGKAPRDWPGPRPAVGILDLGTGPGFGWSTLSPAQWVEAFSSSRLVRELGVPVRRLTTPAEVQTALAAPRQWLALVNPYGETFPATGPGQWPAMVAALRSYVNNGGLWWETGGYSLYRAVFPTAAGWGAESVGPSGLGALGIPVGMGEVEAPAEPLQATATGREWLGPELAEKVNHAASPVNRWAPVGDADPGHLTLVRGPEADYIAGYRLDGWGWLWRVGGFNPSPEITAPVAVAATEYLFTHPPQPVASGGVKYLWHARVQAK